MNDIIEPHTKEVVSSRTYLIKKYVPIFLPIVGLFLAKALLILIYRAGWQQEALSFAIPIQILGSVIGIVLAGIMVHNTNSADSLTIAPGESPNGRKQEKSLTEQQLMKQIELGNRRLQNAKALTEFSQQPGDSQIVERALALAIKISQASDGEIRHLTSEGSYKSVRSITNDSVLVLFDYCEKRTDTFLATDEQTSISGPDGFLDQNGNRKKLWWCPIICDEKLWGHFLLNSDELKDNEKEDLAQLAEILVAKLFTENSERSTGLTESEQVKSLQSANMASFLPPVLPTLLSKYIEGNIREDDGLDYLEQIAETLMSFHSEGKAFGLRPEDARMDSSIKKVYLGQHVDVLAHKREFFPGFSAPELVNSDPTPRSDIFGLGALLFTLYIHKQPDAGTSLGSLIENLPPVSENYLGLDYIIKKCLLPAPENRIPNAAEFLNLLRKVKNHQDRYSDYAVDIGADFNVGIRKGKNRGLNSSDNEDRIYWDMLEDHSYTILAVADGVSKADVGSGYQAAQIFQEKVHSHWQKSLHQNIEPEILIQQIFASANDSVVRRVSSLVQEKKNSKTSITNTMCAAACVALIKKNKAYFGNLGDVRAYLVRDGFAARLTVDDSRIADLILKNSFDLKMIGNINESELNDHIGKWQHASDNHIQPMSIVPRSKTIAVNANDIIVLASDGLYRYARDAEGLFEDILIKVLGSSDSPQTAAFRMISVANQRGGNDNISCVIYKTYKI